MQNAKNFLCTDQSQLPNAKKSYLKIIESKVDNLKNVFQRINIRERVFSGD